MVYDAREPAELEKVAAVGIHRLKFSRHVAFAGMLLLRALLLRAVPLVALASIALAGMMMMLLRAHDVMIHFPTITEPWKKSDGTGT